jgi:hypothetical protein
MTEILNNFQASPEIYAGIILIIIEFIIRLKPTEKNLSILDAIHRIINLVLPNIKKEKTANRVSNASAKIEAFKSKFSIK